MTSANPPTRREVQIAVGLTATLLFSVVLLTAALDGVRRTDCSGFYTGALIIAQGNGSRLYDLAEQERVERQLFGRNNLMPHAQTPFQAFPFAPLTRLRPGKAYVPQRSGQRMILLACMVILYAPPLYGLLLKWKAMYVLAAVLVAFALAAISLARKADLPLAQAAPRACLQAGMG